jgi:hypothetical protein
MHFVAILHASRAVHPAIHIRAARGGIHAFARLNAPAA